MNSEPVDKATAEARKAMEEKLKKIMPSNDYSTLDDDENGENKNPDEKSAEFKKVQAGRYKIDEDGNMYLPDSMVEHQEQQDGEMLPDNFLQIRKVSGNSEAAEANPDNNTGKTTENTGKPTKPTAATTEATSTSKESAEEDHAELLSQFKQNLDEGGLILENGKSPSVLKLELKYKSRGYLMLDLRRRPETFPNDDCELDSSGVQIAGKACGELSKVEVWECEERVSNDASSSGEVHDAGENEELQDSKWKPKRLVKELKDVKYGRLIHIPLYWDGPASPHYRIRAEKVYSVNNVGQHDEYIAFLTESKVGQNPEDLVSEIELKAKENGVSKAERLKYSKMDFDLNRWGNKRVALNYRQHEHFAKIKIEIGKQPTILEKSNINGNKMLSISGPINLHYGFY